MLSIVKRDIKNPIIKYGPKGSCLFLFLLTDSTINAIIDEINIPKIVIKKPNNKDIMQNSIKSPPPRKSLFIHFWININVCHKITKNKKLNILLNLFTKLNGKSLNIKEIIPRMKSTIIDTYGIKYSLLSIITMWLKNGKHKFSKIVLIFKPNLIVINRLINIWVNKTIFANFESSINLTYTFLIKQKINIIKKQIKINTLSPINNLLKLS